MKTVIEMAIESELIYNEEGWCGWIEDTDLRPFIERFAELVRADQDEKYKWDIHSCGPTCKRYACVAIREAVEAEREACAKVCDKQADSAYWEGADACAEAIRARSCV